MDCIFTITHHICDGNEPTSVMWTVSLQSHIISVMGMNQHQKCGLYLYNHSIHLWWEWTNISNVDCIFTITHHNYLWWEWTNISNVDCIFTITASICDGNEPTSIMWPVSLQSQHSSFHGWCVFVSIQVYKGLPADWNIHAFFCLKDMYSCIHESDAKLTCMYFA